jgi:hypothetical protein
MNPVQTNEVINQASEQQNPSPKPALQEGRIYSALKWVGSLFSLSCKRNYFSKAKREVIQYRKESFTEEQLQTAEEIYRAITPKIANNSLDVQDINLLRRGFRKNILACLDLKQQRELSVALNDSIVKTDYFNRNKFAFVDGMVVAVAPKKVEQT